MYKYDITINKFQKRTFIFGICVGAYFVITHAKIAKLEKSIEDLKSKIEKITME